MEGARFYGLTSLAVDDGNRLSVADNVDIGLDGTLLPRDPTALNAALASHTGTTPKDRYIGRDWWIDGLLLRYSPMAGFDANAAMEAMNAFYIGANARILMVASDGLWVCTDSELMFLQGRTVPLNKAASMPRVVLSSRAVEYENEANGGVILATDGVFMLNEGGAITRLDDGRYVVKNVGRVDGYALFSNGAWRIIFTPIQYT